MPSPSIGAVNAFHLSWQKAPAFARSTVFRQPNANGNNHIVGSSYSDSSVIKSEHHLTYYTDEKAFIKSCAALCGQTQTVTEVTNLGTTIVHPDVFVESFRVVKSSSVSGLPGGNEHVVLLEWTVYLPEDW